jgi:hypothetical protein
MIARRIARIVLIVLICSRLAPIVANDAAPSPTSDPRIAQQLSWLDDYHAAIDRAASAGKMALLWFYDEHSAAENSRFATDVLLQPPVVGLLDERCIPVMLPTSTKVLSGGQEVTLLDHAAFSDLDHQPGLAMIDMTDPLSPQFRRVVSVYPFDPQPITAEKLAVLLDLPRGTLTQRTLIFAVRTHPEHPASADSPFSSLLAHETENHAKHQASILLQGHHNWQHRFQAINAQLPGGLLAREVCAESWPGQSLLTAAAECVASWRQSPGHWQAVSGRHALFAYDMQRGKNGVWYATGIFAGRN